MRTMRDIIDLFAIEGGPEQSSVPGWRALSEGLRMKPSTVRQWYTRNSINGRHWALITELASARGIALKLETLARIQAQASARPIPKKIGRPRYARALARAGARG